MSVSAESSIECTITQTQSQIPECVSAPLERPGVILAALVMSAVGAMFYNLLPMVLGVAQDHRALSSSEIGFLGTAYYFGYLLTAASGYLWIRRYSWRKMALGATPVAIGGLLMGLINTQYWLLAAGFAIAGGAMSILYGIAATLIGDMVLASRWYGVKIAVEAFTGAVLLLVLPGTLIVRWGMEGLLVGMAAAVALLMLLAFGLPARGAKQPALQGAEQMPDSQPVAVRKLPVFIALVALALFFTGQTATWAFVERLGNESGFDPVSVGNILSLTLVFALSGSLLIAWIGERFGLFKPFLISGVLFFLGLFGLYLSADSLWLYAVAACTVMFSVGFGIPIPLATTAKLDLDGRLVILTVPAIGFAAMLAPGIAGVINEWGGREPLLAFCALIVLASVGCHRQACRYIA